MEEKEKPFLLVPNNSTVTKASLTTLIQRKNRSIREFPGVVKEVLNGVAFIEITSPIIRTIKQEVPEASVSSVIKIYANLRVQDTVAIHFQDGEWKLSTHLSKDVYETNLHTETQKRLLYESTEIATPLKKRASKRMLERWLQIPSSESTPWAIPGRLENGQKLISKKILDWCVTSGGSSFYPTLQQGFPNMNDWGNHPQYNGMHYFGIFAEDDQFLSVAIAQEEHKALIEAWSDIMKSFAHPKHITAPTSTKPSPNTTSNTSTVAITVLPQQPDQVSVLPPEVPSALLQQITSFQLPLPSLPLDATMSTLAAWTQSDNPALQSRSTDFFLMILSGGDAVRNGHEIRPIWTNWHTKTDLIERLCSLVESGEEASAIRGLVGKPFADPIIATSVSDQLLLRWRRRLVQTHNLQFSELQIPRPSAPKIEEYRREMRFRGLNCADTWLDRLLLCVQTASSLGMMVLLRGSTEQAQALTKILQDVFAHADADIVRIPRKKTLLLGKPSSTDGVFLHSDFALAIRKGGHHQRYGEIGVWNPHFILLEGLGNHGKLDSFISLLPQLYFGQGARLYSEEDNAKYMHEYENLVSSDILTEKERQRRDQLEAFFSAELLGGRSIDEAWRLYASPNTVFLGHLDQINSDTIELAHNALILDIPNIPASNIMDMLQKRKDIPSRIVEIPRKRLPKQTWHAFPIAREQIMRIFEYLQPCNIGNIETIAKQIGLLLATADAWQIPDGNLLAAHISLSILLPRVRCSPAELQQALDNISNIENLSPQLHQILGHWRVALQKIALREDLVHGFMF